MIDNKELIPFSFDEIKEDLTKIALDKFGFSNGEYEGSSIQQIINIIAYELSKQNLNFYLNFRELFLDSAEKKENVIRHSLNLGYIPKRKISYQYKIKLKAKKLKNLLIDKSDKFISKDGIPFIIDDNLIEGSFGYITDINPLYYKNGKSILQNIKVGSKLFLDEDFLVFVENFNKLDKSHLILSSKEIKNISTFETEKQDIFIFTNEYDSNGLRKFQKIGTVDLFAIKDNNFLIQFDSNLDLDSFYTEKTEIRNVVNRNGNLVFDFDLEEPIKYIKTIKVNGTEEYVAINNLKFSENDKNIILPEVKSQILEKKTIQGNSTDFSGIVNLNETINLAEPGINIKIYFDGFTKELVDKDFEIINENTIKIHPQIFSFEDNNLTVDDNNEITTTKNNIAKVDILIIKHSDGTSTELKAEDTDSNGNKVVNFEIVGTNKVKINVDLADDDEISLFFYEYFEVLDGKIAEVSFEHLGNFFEGKEVTVTYYFDEGTDSFLDKTFFFSDLRGEIFENEYPKSDTNPLGWSGFEANNFDKDAMILSFDLNSDGSLYAPYKDKEGNIIQKRINEVFNLYKKKRIYFPDANGKFDENNYFAIIKDIEVKNIIELIVKQGEIIDESVNPELSFQLNKDMINNGYFLIKNDNIEKNSIKLNLKYYQNSSVVEEKLLERNSLLFEKNLEQNSFIVIPDPLYTEYLRVYFDYNCEKKFGDIVFVKVSYNRSLGSKGETEQLIEIQNDNFETVPINNNQNSLLVVKGKDEETIDEIKKNAPKVSNTLGRVVTKNDYKIVIFEEDISDDNNVWGGEEDIPEKRLGNVFITTIKKGSDFSLELKENQKFELKNNIFSFMNNYFEITGKSDLGHLTEIKNKNILFNKLNSLKIIDIKLNYVKPSFVFCNFDIEILGNFLKEKSIEELKKEIVTSIKDFTKKTLEKFEGFYYKSTLIKYIDEIIGDNNGIKVTSNFKIPLIDNLYYFDLNLFENFTQQDLIPDSQGIVGKNDIYVKEVFFRFTEKEKIFSGAGTNEELNFYFLPEIETENFLENGDKIYIEKDPAKAISIFENNKVQGVDEKCKLFQLPIMYSFGSTVKKVGNYFIDIENGIVKFQIFTKLNPAENDEVLDRKYFLDNMRYLNVNVANEKLLFDKHSIGILNSVGITFDY